MPEKGMSVIGKEYRAAEKVPEKARNFSLLDQAILWFGAASLPAAWYYGALMAGFAGLPGAFLLIFGFGWGAVNVFLAAIAMSFIFSIWLGWPAFLQPGYQPYMIASILVICFLQGIFAVAGHKIIRWMEWIAVISLIALGIYQTYIVLSSWGFSSLLNWRPPLEGLKATFGSGVFSITYTITFALLIDLLIAYNWTWEFIGDFSRFAKDKKAGTWGPSWGANIAQYWWFL